MACRLIGLLCETEQLGHVPEGSANTTAEIAEILGGVLGARDPFGTGKLAGGYAQAGKFAGLNFLMFAGGVTEWDPRCCWRDSSLISWKTD